MKIYYFRHIFFTLIILLALNGSVLAKKAAIVIDYDTKEELISINADTLNYPASLTKIMTLFIVFDYLEKNKINLDTKMHVSKNAANQPPSKLNLKPGNYIIVKDAINALIIKSANDVATVVAEHISTTERNFAKLMTKYAKKIGMKKTTFKNASGLPDRAQLTTARDISILSYNLINRFPKYYKLFSQKKFSWNGKAIKTHNRLMLNYDGADGIKTGYIYSSGFQLAFSAVQNNKRLIGVCFGGDTSKQRDKTLRIIMDKAFEIISDKDITSPKKNLKNQTTLYSLVVGTFKYKKNAEKQINTIRNKYPKTTSNKEYKIVKIKIGNGYLYESRFYFSKINDAKKACKRLKKYKRDCFIRY